MCTVSFIHTGSKFIITSNRDEHISRPNATAPLEEIVNGCKLIYPKDSKAGGSWFAINENGTTAVLLNGAFEKHKKADKYAASRGIILINIISNPAPVYFFRNRDLFQIEPFTLILFEDRKLFELRWDGNRKYLNELDSLKSHIWSSSTLYSKEAVRHKENLFRKFMSTSSAIDEETVYDFHSGNGDDHENGFILNRSNGLKTFSITQAVLDRDDIELKHHDLLSNRVYTVSMSTNRIIN